jgi:Metal-dependent hydrolases of the beta-lactamase superfamily III
MTKVIFLGTNGWYDSPTGNTVSTLIKTKNFNIVLDAGNGIAKLPQYINDNKPTFLFISHFHLDHVEGLHTICLNRFLGGLNIIVQEGGTEILNNLMKLPYMLPLKNMRFSTKIIETNDNIGRELPFKASFLQIDHSVFTQGMRMEVDGFTITYCLDTGYCDNVVALAKNADLLILECTLKPDTQAQNHLNPNLCARIAREAGAKKLALTHFEAKDYSDMETRMKSEQFIRELHKDSFVCRDGMDIEL